MIEFRNVTKSYGDFTAVEDISFSACDSSVCGLIGYNGAGKTTLIKCAAGLYKPDSGKVLIDGESTYNSDEVRSRLFFVPDDLFFPVGSTPNSAARFYKDYYPEFSFGNFERMLKLFELDGDARAKLDALEPLFIDEFPMELEEIFLQETEDKSDEISKVFE